MPHTPRTRVTVTLHELPAPVPDPDRVVFVTNAVRRRGGLRARAAQAEQAGQGRTGPRPVLAAVVR